MSAVTVGAAVCLEDSNLLLGGGSLAEASGAWANPWRRRQEMQHIHPRGLAHRPRFREGWGRPDLGSGCQRKHLARAVKEMCGDTHTLNGTDERQGGSCWEL